MSLPSWNPEQQAGSEEEMALHRMLDATTECCSLGTPDSDPFGSRLQSILSERCGDIEDGRLTVSHAIDSIPLPSSELSPAVLRDEIISHIPQFGVGTSGSTGTPRSIPTSLRLGLWISASEKIPQELFDNILSYVVSRRSWDPESFPQWPSSAGKTSSLVCRYWANRCREYMFSGTTLEVSSCEKAEMLVHYVLHGCPSLIPLHTLISGIIVHQRYKMPYSFLHRISLLMSLKLKFSTLSLDGPVPNGFPSCKLDTLHWSIPSSIPTPPSMLAYGTINLSQIHLPSFAHTAKYISHFQSATNTWIRMLTWHDDGVSSSPRATARVRRGNLYKTRNEGFFFSVMECTNNTRLFLQALIANPRSPLYALSDDPQEDPNAGDRGEMVGFLQETCARFSRTAIRMDICWKIDPQDPPVAGTKLMNQIIFHIPSICFTFTMEAHDSPTPDFHVVGLLVTPLYYTLEIETPFDPQTGDLILRIQRFPMLHAIAIIFNSYKELSLAMSHYHPLAYHPLILDHKYILVLHRDYNDNHDNSDNSDSNNDNDSDNDNDDNSNNDSDSDNNNNKLDFPEVVPLPPQGEEDYIGINPITLLPTGQSWKGEDDIIPSLLAIPHSWPSH